jgi:hypothetical protein
MFEVSRGGMTSVIMTSGVYERSLELIEEITKRIVEWNIIMHRNGNVRREIVEKQRIGRLRYYATKYITRIYLIHQKHVTELVRV